MGSRPKTSMIYLLLITHLPYLAVVFAGTTQTKTCPEGQYLFQFDGLASLCVECQNETFMPWKNHTEKKCFECQKIKDRSLEIFIRPCNRFRDADIQCVDGYFRRLGKNPSCIKCRAACPEHYVQVHRCENFTDIGCCPGENYDYDVSEKGIRFCRERPWMCGRGQYLDKNVNGCKPCPENTFMPENYHPFTECWHCQYVSDANLPLHVVLTEPCTSTHPPQYGCKDGYYVNHNISYRNNIGCSQCQTCDEGMYVGRKCDMYHDTVCCDNHKANILSAVYVPHGELCINETEEVHLSPSMETLSVREGGCQSVLCYTTLVPGRKKPELTWVGPNIDKHQQTQFEEKGNQTAETVYFNTLKVCDFSAADEGNYECRYTVDNVTQASQIYIKLEGKNETYNTPTCNKHCRESERSDKSQCDDTGICLFGCMDGYEGAKCDTRLEGKNNTYNIPLCDKTCNKHCRESERSDKSQCDDNGICLFGCMDGYEGAKCDTRLAITDTGYDTSTVFAFCMIALTAGFSLGLIVLIILSRRFGTTSRARPGCLGRFVQMILPQNTCQACRDAAAERVIFKEESTSTGNHYVDMPRASPTGTANDIQKPENQNLLSNDDIYTNSSEVESVEETDTYENADMFLHETIDRRA